MSPPQLSRRSFCKWGSSLALSGMLTRFDSGLLLAKEPSAAGAGTTPDRLKELHTPKLTIPAVTRNGNHVPVVVKMNHPMEPGHYIRKIQFLNESDPIPSKGIFHPTPANGEIYFAFQARMHSGTSTVKAIAECNLHGAWTAYHQITIPEGQGGCATAGVPKQIAATEEILPPVIRIPEIVRRGRLAKRETAEVQVKFQHPSKTGLAFEGNRFVQIEEPLYLTSMQVFYGDRLVTRYEMTPGLSDNPFVKFKLRFTDEKAIRIVFTNSLGQQFSAFTEVALAKG
jgi:desulfoferrodoxin (superoxide reductase-like protein)